jgi:hypothetical protein
VQGLSLYTASSTDFSRHDLCADHLYHAGQGDFVLPSTGYSGALRALVICPTHCVPVHGGLNRRRRPRALSSDGDLEAEEESSDGSSTELEDDWKGDDD